MTLGPGICGPTPKGPSYVDHGSDGFAQKSPKWSLRVEHPSMILGKNSDVLLKF